MDSLPKTQDFISTLRTTLLERGWITDGEEKLVKRYSMWGSTSSLDQRFHQVTISKRNFMDTTIHGKGQDIALYPNCDEHFCNDPFHFKWKINLDTNNYKYWRDNGRMFWLEWETDDFNKFYAHFMEQIAAAEDKITSYV